jgi:glycogen operon protein
MRCLGVRLAGEMSDEFDTEGNLIIGDTLFFALNAHHEAITFQLPGYQKNERWVRVLDTAADDWGKRFKLRSRHYPLQGRSIVVFQLQKPVVPDPSEPRW